MDRFTMRESGECYVFDDDRIWHMLTPVAVLEGNQYAYRDTLAFDMLPAGWEPVKRSETEGLKPGLNPGIGVSPYNGPANSACPLPASDLFRFAAIHP